MGSKATFIAKKLKNIREAFISQLPSQLEIIKEAYASLGNDTPDREVLDRLHRCLHNLKGVSANFGLHDLSTIVTESEQLIKKVRKGDVDPENRWRSSLKGHIAQLEREVTHLDVSKVLDLQALEIVAAAETFHDEERKVVYLCEDDPIQRLNLTTQISCFGFDVVSFGELEQFCNALRNGNPDVIVMDLVYPELPTGGADAIREVQADMGRDIPTVFISSHSDLSSRLAALRAGSSAYFVKPINITDLVTTLHRLTAREAPEPYRILIVDDDLLSTEMTSVQLRGAGMEVRSLSDPLLTLPILLDFKPDLILMDMYMPSCNGMELAKAIRQIDEYFSIPIIFLSSETDPDAQFEARRMGGDEFLVKPVKPNHLISTVTVLAERMKIIRSFMVRDSMTGLYNYAALKEYLDLAIKQARRQQETVCLAMIDLDYFKETNDNFGHEAGDRVLIALARLLRQRLRKSDVIGRTGGEEFAVILPQCTIHDAGQLLQQLLENFAAISFPAGDGVFSCTFSCGVAPLDRYDTAEKLYKAADEALYVAKREGRNRVIAVGCEDTQPGHTTSGSNGEPPKPKGKG